jgi:hypothetical protein
VNAIAKADSLPMISAMSCAVGGNGISEFMRFSFTEPLLIEVYGFHHFAGDLGD